jgi:hypothetical protein
MGRVKFLLDTNICIHYLNGQFRLNQKTESVGEERGYEKQVHPLATLTS